MRRPQAALAVLTVLAGAALCGTTMPSAQQTTRGGADAALPAGYWSADDCRKILDKALTIRLAPDLSGLTAAEKKTVETLIAVGRIFQRLYEESLHHQALEAHASLVALDRELGSPKRTRDLMSLYRLSRGPIQTTLDNTRVPFVPADSIVPGKNVYPWGVAKDEIETFLGAHPEERGSLLAVRTVVRRARPDVIRGDLASLDAHPALDTLHPGLRARLEALLAAAGGGPDGRAETGRTASGSAVGGGFYAVPYAVAYADDLIAAHALLSDAAATIEPEDADFGRMPRQRARDLLTNDYEAGDAAWVTGSFRTLNGEIGAYETYDDELYGAKAFFGLNVLIRDRAMSDEIVAAISSLQELENSLPYEPHKKVRETIPVGVYNVVADFGQSRGTNTATILPNESHAARTYGRTILLRYNILTDPQIFATQKAAWDAAVVEEHREDLAIHGNFYRTLWHEIGHYLGVDRDRHGRELRDALQENSPTLEEMKADLASLYLVDRLRASGYYDDAQRRAVYASGIFRLLLKNRPRRDQPYQTMQLMQMNYFIEHGLLTYDPGAQGLRIDYDGYHAAVTALLREVLARQAAGDKAATDRFIDRFTTWDDGVHEAMAREMRRTETSRYRLVLYSALDG